MSFFVLIIVLLPFAAAVLLGFWRRRGPRITDPSCGECRYIVRGLEGNICPECGSDLSEVGILYPGTIQLLPGWKRALLWLLVAPMPTLILFLILMPLCVPQWLRTSQRRVIFSQVPYCNVVLTANSEGKELIFGYARVHPTTQPIVVPAEVLFLTTGGSAAGPPISMDVRLPARTFSYRASANRMVTGQFDAAAIEKWLNMQGFTDPRVADRAADILAAVNEMGTPAGGDFTHFLPARAYPHPGIAHPTVTNTRTQPNELTTVVPIVLFILIFLAGLPIVLRRRGRGAPPVQNEMISTGEAPVPH
jgi:hypothetical protein